MSSKTLGGVDVELLNPLELAAGAGDAQATAALLVSGRPLPIGPNVGHGRPLFRTALHWASFGGNAAVITAVLTAVEESAALAAYTSGAFEFPEGEEEAAQAEEAAKAAAAAKAKSDALKARCMGVSKIDGMPKVTTSLHLAVEGGHVGAVVVLLEAGANDAGVDGVRKMPLCLAVELGHVEVALELIRRGRVHIDSQQSGGGTALHSASWSNNLEMTNMLLQEGAALDTIDQGDHTPLHLAAASSGPNTAAIIEALAAAGANLAALGGPDPYKETPLHLAVTGPSGRPRRSDWGPPIRALVAAGADLHLPDEWHECSPVEMAMWDGNLEALSVFLELGLDPNHRGPFNPPFRNLAPDASEEDRLSHIRGRQPYGGQSLLHSAAAMNCEGAVKLLLAAGAREDVPAFEDIHREDAPPVPTLPIDLVGVGTAEAEPLKQRRPADAIRNMLAGAHLYRKGWLSVLRARFDAGESVTGGSDGSGGSGGEQSRGGGGGSDDGAEDPRPPRRQKRAAGHGSSGSNDVAMTAVEDEAWYGAAVWIARVPGPEVFRIITEFL